ncbi:DUF3299 domain-containing protein [Granulosicoccaceae sp. 1_MG-2023]|nr:DUF3299 domain-containing protein [Granulosicoccaceae sp. 1_MG-2023]
MIKCFRLQAVVVAVLMSLGLAGCGDEKDDSAATPAAADAAEPQLAQTVAWGSVKDAQAGPSAEPQAAETISWRELEPADYDPQVIIDQYAAQLNEFQDGDPAAMEIYDKIQNELNNAPVNADMDGQWIRLPGFIAPLEVRERAVWEFLLVPYFGACIHVPPPPVNQTVFVTVQDGQQISADTAYLPVWVSGKLKVSREDKGIGIAGYVVTDAMIEPYTEE